MPILASTSKIALITGAAGGIGFSTAQRLVGAGWHVWGTGLPQDSFNTLQRLGVNALVMDITQESSIAHALQSFTRLDALINCAAIQAPAPLEHLPISELQHLFDVNVFGHLRVIQHALPLLKSSKGRIINVSSLMGKVAFPLLGGYSMSKHALEALSDTLRLELAPFGVTVCVVAMGAIDTPMTHQMAQHLQRAYENHAESSEYDALYKAMQATLETQTKNAIPPQKVADVIFRAVTDRNPKPRIIVDTPTFGLSLMRRLAPLEVADKILSWVLRLPK